MTKTKYIKNYFKRYVLMLFIIISIGFSVLNISLVNAETPIGINDNILNSKNDAKDGVTRSAHLETTYNNDKKYFFLGENVGEKGALNFLIRFAKDAKNLFLGIAFVYLIVGVLMVLWTEMSDDDMKKWKNQILWTGIGIIVMQISYTTIKANIFNKNIDGLSALDFGWNVMFPIIDLVGLLASFVFIAIAIYSFYSIVTSAGSEDGAKKGKLMIVYAIIGFIMVKLAEPLVNLVYLQNYKDPNCHNSGGITDYCKINPNLEMDDTVILFTTIVNYAMGFIGIIIVLLSIYAGFLLLTSAGSEEKLKKVKNIFLYIFLGLALILISYILFKFFVSTKLGAV